MTPLVYEIVNPLKEMRTPLGVHKEWTGKTIYFNFNSIFGYLFFLQKQSNKKESRVEQKTKINVFSDYSLGVHGSFNLQSTFLRAVNEQIAVAVQSA